VTYTVTMARPARRGLTRLPADVYERLRSSIVALADDPRPHGCKKMTGRDGWRIRDGDYRAIYLIDDEKQTVLVVQVGHRRDVYR
jgi:mRNA interferase RelE/StbE